MEEEHPQESMRDSVQCGACDGRGRWLLSGGVGPLGDDCPYCYRYRFEGYPTGEVPVTATKLPGEHTGERFYHVINRETQKPTKEPQAFRVIQLPQEPTLYPQRGKKAISRPRRRTNPMPETRIGRVRHFTGDWWNALKTGPRTHQIRVAQQKAFVEAYGTMKAQRQRRVKQREEIYFALTLILFIFLAAAVAILTGVFIGIYIFHLAIVHAH